MLDFLFGKRRPQAMEKGKENEQPNASGDKSATEQETKSGDEKNEDEEPEVATENEATEVEGEPKEDGTEKKVKFTKDTKTQSKGKPRRRRDYTSGSESEGPGWNPFYDTASCTETDGEPLPAPMKKKMKKLLRRELRNVFKAPPEPTDTDIEEIEKVVKERRKKKKAKNDVKLKKSYYYGRWLMIGLAIVSIPMDGWKMYQGIEKVERALEAPDRMEVFDFYSTTIATHVVGLGAAIGHNLWVTVGCRVISTYMYQLEFSSKGNSSVPTDPKELQKYIREKVPKHKLPKGYVPPPPSDDELNEDAIPGMPKRNRRKSPMDRFGKKFGSKATSKKNVKGETGKAAGKKGKGKDKKEAKGKGKDKKKAKGSAKKKKIEEEEEDEDEVLEEKMKNKKKTKGSAKVSKKKRKYEEENEEEEEEEDPEEEPKKNKKKRKEVVEKVRKASKAKEKAKPRPKAKAAKKKKP